MKTEDKITVGILGGSLMVAVIIALSTIVFSGCETVPKEPIVHPTDEQIENGAQGGKTTEPAYVPWWAD